MRVAVVVRSYNSGATLPACLRSIREQSREVDLIVVDSESVDDSTKIAEQHDARVIGLAHEEYWPGRALNLGIGSAEGSDICLIVSSHVRLPDPQHVARVIELHRELDVDATNGEARAPDGSRLVSTYVDTHWPHQGNVLWGFSNHCSSIRRSTWQATPFDEDLDACEDKEWAKRVHLARGSIAYSPDLLVPAVHRRQEGMRRLVSRAYREGFRCGELAAGEGDFMRTAWRHLATTNAHRWPPGVLQLARPTRAAERVAAIRGLRNGLQASPPNGESVLT